MVYAVQALVGFRNTTRRDGVKQNVITRLNQNVPWGETIVSDTYLISGDPAIEVEVRFQTKAEQTSFWNDVLAFMGTGLNGPTLGSEIWKHDCGHDDSSGTTDCSNTERQAW